MKQNSFISTKRSFSLVIKTVAYVLSFLLILYAVPATVYAEIIDALEEISEQAPSDADSAALPNEGVVYEVLDRREETVKHFRDSDGSYVAAQYEYPVHELDANGEWQDIDNSLAEAGSEYATPNARVKFAKKITGNETLFTLHDGNRKITMSLSGAKKKVAGQVTMTIPKRYCFIWHAACHRRGYEGFPQYAVGIFARCLVAPGTTLKRSARITCSCLV